MTPTDRRRIGPLALGSLLRRLRDRDRLVALVGAWDDGRDLVAYDPVRRLGGGQDPFALGTGPDGARDAGTWVGWWGYQLGARLEDVGPVPPRPTRLPDADLALYEVVLRRVDGVWWFESAAGADETERRWAQLQRLLGGPSPAPAPYALAPFTSVPSYAAHREAVRTTIAHIHAGDLFQANICLRLESRLSGEGGALEMFVAGVAALEPAYAAYVAGDGGTVVSLSPELYVRRTGRRVVSSPIKGTAPAATDPADLAASTKNRAENVMIVDLVRNDLGRVAVTGSVRVTTTAAPRARAGVWHLVSDVEAVLRPGTTDADLLRASFPPGSVTGAPKVRAMQVIGEQEATGREAYTGAIGYAGPRGLEANVAIRTFEVRGDDVWLGVGGGVVADSDPDDELRECGTKAAPLLRAVGGALAEPLPAGRGAARSGVAEHGVAGRRSASSPRAADAAVGTQASPVSVPDLPRPDPALGLFDTMLVRDGVASDLDGHLARFSAAAAATYGAVVDVAALADEARGVAAGVVGDHRLRVTYVPADRRTAVRAVPTEVMDAPWILRPATVPGGLGDVKWTDRRLLDTLPGAPWDATRDPLLVDVDGTVLETGRGSLFLVRDDGVHTPALDGRNLPGVTRAGVLRVLRDAGVPVFERRVDVTELAGAVELFVTNAIGRVRPATEVAGFVRLAAGPTTAWIRTLLDPTMRHLDHPPVEMSHRSAGAGAGAGARARAGAGAARVLLIDNYDSFVHNLAQYVRELGAEATVVRNDAVTVAGLQELRRTGALTHLVISPGPGAPSEAGISVEAVRALGATTPILGVCLGHQAIGEAYGAAVVRAPRPVHGSPSLVHHDGRGVYAGLDGPLVAARYHSLIVRDLPDDLVATAWNGEKVLMGVRHRVHPVEGVQIHPESILTPRGHDLLATFLSPT